MSTIWKPFSLTKSPYAVLVLNRPIDVKEFDVLWNEAKIRVCVDGGSNQLFELKSTKFPKLANPDLITGDFDSILPSVKCHFESQGTKIVETADQNYTDFTKALMTVESGIASGEYPQVDSFIVVVDHGGRLDQLFANITTLFIKTNLKIYLSCDSSISWLLTAGTHEIEMNREYITSKPHCGIIPLCGTTKIKTAGLAWNLDGDYHFHGIVSTNNITVEEAVQIETEKDVLWTMDTFGSENQ